MLGIRSIADNVVKFVGVFLQVVKLVVAVTLAIEVQQLVAPVAHSIVTHDVVLGGTIIVVIVEVLTPILGRLSFPRNDRQQRSANHLPGLFCIGNVQERRGEVDVLHEGIALPAALHARRIDEKGRAERLFVHEAFVEPPVLAHVEALVAGIDNHRIFHQTGGFQIVEQAPHLLVDTVDDAHVVADVALVLPPEKGIAREVLRQHLLVAGIVVGLPNLPLFGRHAIQLMAEAVAVAFVRVTHAGFYLRDLKVVAHFHVLLNAHLLFVGSTSSCGIIVVEGLRQGELHVLVEVEHVERRHPVAMRRLVMHEEGEGLASVPLVEETDGMVGDEIGGIALLLDILATRLLRAESGVVVVALPRQDVICVEPLRFAQHVPLANHGRLIASLLQRLADEGSLFVDGTIQRALTALVAVHSRHETCAAGGAERVLDVCALEEHATLGQAVEIGCRSLPGERMSIGADGLIRVIVAHDIDDVPALGMCRTEGTTAKYEGKVSVFHGVINV